MATGPVSKVSGVRRPRGVVRINGKNASFVTMRVENKTHFSADTWSVELEGWSQPEGLGFGFFADSANTTVEILMGFLTPQQAVSAKPASPVSLIIGQVDDIDEDLNSGRLTISGRDYTARLIDTKTANKWPDHTASWIVTELAKQVGLTPNVTATTTPVGQYYNDNFSSVSRDTPMWDVVKFLAEQEGYDAYVVGQTLYFGPPQADANADPFSVIVQRAATGGIWSSAKTIRLGRSETVAGDISVVVLSHSQQTGKGVKATSTRAGKKVGGSSSSKATTQNYVIRRAGLTQEQAQQLADQTIADLTRKEKTAEMTMEGDVAMNVRRRVHLSGTSTSFDLDYYVSSMSHAYDHKSAGYEMSLSLKNHPTLSQESTV